MRSLKKHPDEIPEGYEWVVVEDPDTIFRGFMRKRKTPEEILADLKLASHHANKINVHLDNLLSECEVAASARGTIGPGGIISDYELVSVNLISPGPEKSV
jgi:hypothetical protein